MANISKQKLYSLDVLKGFLIFSIVILHTKDIFSECINSFELFYRYGGYIGNTFFFAASGFGISYGYRNRIIENDISFSKYFISRIKKFYLLYLITSIIIFFFTIHAEGLSFFTTKDIILNVFLVTTGWISNKAPFSAQCWFLSVLILIYIIYYFLVKIFKSKDIYCYLVMVMIGCAFMYLHLEVPFCYYEDGIGFAAFFIGCCVARLYSKLRETDNYECIIFALIVADIVVICFLIIWGIFSNSRIAMEIIFCVLIAPGLLLICISPSINVFLGAKTWITGTIGIISMNVFLWHVIIVRVYNAIFLRLGLYDILGLKISYAGYITATAVFCFIISKLTKKRDV